MTVVSRSVLPALLVLTVALGGLSCAALKKTVGYPSVRVKDVHVGGLNFTGLKFTFDIDIENHYNAQLPLLGFDYALTSDGNLLIEGDTPVSSMIPAKATRTVPLNVTIPYGTIMDLKDRVRPGEAIPYRVDIGLKVDAPVVGEVKLPMDADGTFNIPSFP